MATFGSPMAARGPFAPNALAPAHAAPPGTFAPGTKVQVGNVRVIIEKYLSEGGFAHVYVVQLPKPVDGTDRGVLKRVAVPDKENLANMRTEVETMKRLRGRSKIVKYFDSHASQLKGGGYEVFLLMEFCQGGGLIDFMNTRLQNRLTEPEILKIFTDVSEGVADMHYLKPPLLHRDLKVENVLIAVSGSSRTFKLCDFGSTAPPRPAATTAAEGRLIEDDVQRHTTLQYRSPEMIDVYRKQPIDEKSDIWALGVLLYKLCYYTTPFEEVGQMAILNASFKYPGYPRFSDGLKSLIASMLRENPARRPNIYQVISQACGLQGKPVPIKDIYTGRSHSEAATRQQMTTHASTQSNTGATLAPPPVHAVPSVPDIAPMRRGRPDKPVSHHGSAKPSPSPLRMIDSSDGSDPFAALDGRKAQAGDEISNRFPTLDQFSLLTDTGKKFEFDANESKTSEKTSDLSQRITYALADDAFARPPSPAKPKPQGGDSVARAKALTERKKAAESKALPLLPKPSASVPIPQKDERRSESTKLSRSPPKSLSDPYANRPIHRFPSHDDPPKRAVSNATPHKTRTLPPNAGSRLANLLQEDAAQSDAAPSNGPASPISSRPSLEGGRPTMRDLDSTVHRSRSLNMRARPVSVNMGAHPTHIRDREVTNADYTFAIESAEPGMIPLTAVESEKNIHSDIDFLKAREEEERLKSKSHQKRLSSGSQHGKRTSLPSMGMSAVKGTTNLLTGRFGDAFKKFEGHNDQNDRSHHRHHHHKRNSSFSPIRDTLLSPIAGSEATDLSEDRSRLELMETEELSPEMRRELEKLQLEAEERRVANAAAEYRKRAGEKGGGRDTARAANIQNKVQSLLQKENQEPAVHKTASGYGRFTDLNGDVQTSRFGIPVPAPIPAYRSSDQRGREIHAASAPQSSTNIAAQRSGMASSRTQRPMAPPKPQLLRTGGNTAPLQGTPNTANSNQAQPGGPGDDWEENFSKRYPSLSGLEMVEADLDSEPRSKVPSNVRIREV